MDHGSHTFYLAFEWLRAYPTAISARMSTMGPFDTEDDLSCSLRFPTGVASAHLSWQAGVRKVLYTIHGDRGAIRVEDDNVEVARREVAREGEPPSAEWSFERRDISVGLDGFEPRHLVQLVVRRLHAGRSKTANGSARKPRRPSCACS